MVISTPDHHRSCRVLRITDVRPSDHPNTTGTRLFQGADTLKSDALFRHAVASCCGPIGFVWRLLFHLLTALGALGATQTQPNANPMGRRHSTTEQHDAGCCVADSGDPASLSCFSKRRLGDICLDVCLRNQTLLRPPVAGKHRWTSKPEQRLTHRCSPLKKGNLELTQAVQCVSKLCRLFGESCLRNLEQACPDPDNPRPWNDGGSVFVVRTTPYFRN